MTTPTPTRKRRVRVETRKRPEDRGYVGYITVQVQILEEKRWWGWAAIDEEIVPAQYLIDVATVGSSPIAWTSKFWDVIYAARKEKALAQA